ncbi:MAG: hypothetical protein WCE54_21660 [Ignavibacteriaceae bacterium]
MKNKVPYSYLIIILFLGICFAGEGCKSIFDVFQEDNNKLKNENTSLKFSLDSLSNSYNLLYDDYSSIKNKKPDTVFVSIPIDSINWIDSTRYILKDSIVLITYDTLKVRFRDSLIYNFIDTTVYNLRDSVIITYDDRTFPIETIEKYLNLFFKTDNVSDTTGLHFNFEVFEGTMLSYKKDSLYQVPDSIIGWGVEWWKGRNE